MSVEPWTHPHCRPGGHPPRDGAIGALHQQRIPTPNLLEITMAKRGLYANIHAKRKRIKAGSGETMRKKGAKGAPKAGAFARSAKTAKKKKRR